MIFYPREYIERLHKGKFIRINLPLCFMMVKIMIKEKQIKMYLLIPLIIGILIPFYTYQADYKFPVEYGYMCILISFL